MRTLHLLSSFLCVAAIGVASRAAHAQALPSVTGIVGAVQRCEPPVGSACVSADGAGENPHPSGVPLNDVNLEDCSADLAYELTVGISNPSSAATLQVWAGPQDCTPLAARQPGATAGCWPVRLPQVALVNPSILDVRARDIAAGAFSATHSPVYAAATDPAVCQAPRTAATSLSLYLFFTDTASNAIGTTQVYPLGLDARAGGVSGPISLTENGAELAVKVPPTTDPDTTSYNVYCDPGQGAATNAGDGGIPASDAAAPPQAACGASALTAGSRGTSEPGGGSSFDKYLCGSSAASATSLNASGLETGRTYNVAVAAVDAFGNVGPLSNVVCGEAGAQGATGPESTAKGGSCSAAGAGVPASTSRLGVILAAALGAIGRKRKRAR